MIGIESRVRKAVAPMSERRPEEIGRARPGSKHCQLTNSGTTYVRVRRTGVRSLDPSSSVALVAASMRSSQRLPYNAAALGSTEKALRSPLLRLANSLLRFRSCLARRACWLRLLFRGLFCCRCEDEKLRCNDGAVTGLPGDLCKLLGNKPAWSCADDVGKDVGSCMNEASSNVGSTW